MVSRDPRLEGVRVAIERMVSEIHQMREALDALFQWVRTCPQCGRELRREDPMETVRCVCGWVWS
jgi:hypothetical protein